MSVYKQFVQALDFILITFIAITNLTLIMYNAFNADFVTVALLIISSICISFLYGTRREKKVDYK